MVNSKIQLAIDMAGNAVAGVTNLNNNFIKTIDSVNNVNNSIKNVEKSVEQFKIPKSFSIAVGMNSILELNQKLSAVTGNLAQKFNTMTSEAMQFQRSITTAIADNAANFAIDGTFNLSTEHATKKLKDLENGVKRTAAKIGASFADVSLSANVLMKNGYSVSDSLNVAPLANRFKNVFNMDIGGASQLLADVSRFSGLPAGEYNEFIDVIDSVTFAAKTAGMPLQQMQTLINQNGVAMRQMGVSIDDISKLSVMFSSAGVASDNITSSIDHLLKGTQKLKNEYKSNFINFGKGNTLDLSRNISSVIEQISRLDQKSKALTLEKMFGKKGLDSVAAFNALSSVSAEKINQINKGLNAAKIGNLSEQMANLTGNTTAANAEKIKNSFNNLAIIAGLMLLPAIDGLVKIAYPFFEFLQNNEWAVGIFVAVAGLLLFTSAVLGIIVALASVKTALVALNLPLETIGTTIKMIATRFLLPLALFGIAYFLIGELCNATTWWEQVLYGIAIAAAVVAGIMFLIGAINPFAWVLAAIAAVGALVALFRKLHGKATPPEIKSPQDDLTPDYEKYIKGFPDPEKYLKGFSGLSAAAGMGGDSQHSDGYGTASASPSGSKVTLHEIRIFLERDLAAISSDGDRSSGGRLTLRIQD